MITLKHLMAVGGGPRGPGPYMDSWPKIVLFIVLIAALASIVQGS